MKKMILLFVLLFSFSQAGSMQSFLDDNINSVVEEPGYYKSQTRGLYALGSSTAKFNNMGNLNPFNIEAPHFGMGCGGIDATFGGFSYLNLEYLVEKLKAVSAAAPAFAFQMALGVLCEDCKTTLNWLENIANQINNLNMDTCKASKRIGAFAADKIMSAIDGNMNSGQSNNFIKETENAKSNQSSTWSDYLNTVSYYMGGDSAAAKKSIKYATLQGSLLKEALEDSSKVDTSFLGKDSQGGNFFTSIIRAMIGDVVGYKAAIKGGGGKESGSGDGTPKLKFIPPTSADYGAFLEGEEISYVYVKTRDENKGMPIVKNGYEKFSGIKKLYETRLRSILNKMKSRQDIAATDRAFINKMPLPIAKYLNTAVLIAIDDTKSLAEYLSIVQTNAFLEFITRTTSKALSYQITNSSDNQNPKEVKEYLIMINENAIKLKKDANSWFAKSVQNWQQKQGINNYYMGLEQRLKAKLGNSPTFTAYF